MDEQGWREACRGDIGANAGSAYVTRTLASCPRGSFNEGLLMHDLHASWQRHAFSGGCKVDNEMRAFSHLLMDGLHEII